MKGEIVEVMEDFAKDGLTMLIVTHEPAIIERIATAASAPPSGWRRREAPRRPRGAAEPSGRPPLEQAAEPSP